MSIKQLFTFISTDPVNLSIKTKLLAVLASFIAIFIAGLLASWLTTEAKSILVASMGATSVLLFLVPNSPLSQPWQVVGGQTVSAVVGVSCALVFNETIWAATSAVSLSIFFMLLLRCLHPPGAATALAPAVMPIPPDYGFVLLPVGINVLTLLTIAIFFNRWLLGYNYPLMPQAKKTESKGISNMDLKQALKSMNTFMDISLDDLDKLIGNAEKNSFKRFKGHITCADIMVKNVFTVEYGTEVEEAWHLMIKEKLKAMPVIDRSQRVIGIITWADFFKFINFTTYQTFQDKLLNFIKRTPDVTTNKPEAVGHIMSTHVTTLAETTHIVELIPLMSQKEIRQIPIVNAENRLVGMVYQTHLIAALYDEQLANIINTQNRL